MPQFNEGSCACGCGQETPLASRTMRSRGWIKGEPIRYVKGHGRWRASRNPLVYEIDDQSGCHIFQGNIGVQGYGVITKEGRKFRAHIWAWESATGKSAKGFVLHHKCGNRACVNPTHLELMTASEHAALHIDRSRLSRAKLTVDEVREIRSMSGRLADIAEQFGVSIPTVSMIRNGHIWKGV